jgi:hypothetical protein
MTTDYPTRRATEDGKAGTLAILSAIDCGSRPGTGHPFFDITYTITITALAKILGFNDSKIRRSVIRDQ